MKRFKTLFLAVLMFFSVSLFSTGCDALLVFLNQIVQVDNNSSNNGGNGSNSKGKTHGTQQDDQNPNSKGKKQGGG